MLQRIGFLAAILHDPEFIILDEPLSGLDPVGRKGLKDVISEVHKKGKTIFFSSHVVPDIEEICDRVIFLEKGKLIYDGSVQTLIHSSPNTEIAIKVKGNRDVVENILKGENLVRSWDDMGSDYQYIKVSAESKQKTLSLLVNHSIDIVSLDVEKPTLEEIFYKIKNK
jgi:ABC-2 type transport system ATP-binding protein